MANDLAQLGADVWVPMRTRRSVVHPGEPKLDRYRKASAEAAKQCGRPWWMQVAPLTPFEQVLAAHAEAGLRLLADPAGEPTSAVAHGLAGVETAVVLIGPEGGFTDEEKQAARSAGFVSWRFAEHVLRVETAGAAAVAVLRRWHKVVAMPNPTPPEPQDKPIERPPAPKPPDLRERGGGGKTSDRRLFMQLLVFTHCPHTRGLIDAAQAAGLDAVVYESLHDPRGAALLTWGEDPAEFAGKLRTVLRGEALAKAELLREMTMLGRTYTIGYEPDLDEVLLRRPVRHATNPDWPWAVWYPLRRSGAFARLPRDEQMPILKEHGTIGFGFGAGTSPTTSVSHPTAWTPTTTTSPSAWWAKT